MSVYLSSNRWTNFLENCKNIYRLYMHACALIHAFILNRLDYYSSLYLGLPYVRLRYLDSVLRAAARLISCVPKFGHIGEFMRDTLHWLPVCHCILYRVSIQLLGVVFLTLLLR